MDLVPLLTACIAAFGQNAVVVAQVEQKDVPIALLASSETSGKFQLSAIRCRLSPQRKVGTGQ
jgi:hypothetical protein